MNLALVTLWHAAHSARTEGRTDDRGLVGDCGGRPTPGRREGIAPALKHWPVSVCSTSNIYPGLAGSMCKVYRQSTPASTDTVRRITTGAVRVPVAGGHCRQD